MHMVQAVLTEERCDKAHNTNGHTYLRFDASTTRSGRKRAVVVVLQFQEPAHHVKPVPGAGTSLQEPSTAPTMSLHGSAPPAPVPAQPLMSAKIVTKQQASNHNIRHGFACW